MVCILFDYPRSDSGFDWQDFYLRNMLGNQKDLSFVFSQVVAFVSWRCANSCCCCCRDCHCVRNRVREVVRSGAPAVDPPTKETPGVLWFVVGPYYYRGYCLVACHLLRDNPLDKICVTLYLQMWSASFACQQISGSYQY